jgi:dTDP-4-dehydrorhamnose 3,5-epimerase-like enzyme
MVATNFKLIELPTFADTRGVLTVLERLLPFEPKRFYWIYGADGQVRGGHRHRLTHQALIALSGTISIFMNDGNNQEVISLDRPYSCLLVAPKDWHTMTFGQDSILLVLSSHHYDPTDYIDEQY